MDLAAEVGSVTRRNGLNIASVTQLLIGLIWIWSAVGKLVGLGHFRNVVLGHGIVPEDLIFVTTAVPVIEALLGFVLISIPSHRSRLTRVFLVVLASLLFTFSRYLAFVPTESLKLVGCGCSGAASVMQTRSAWGAILTNGLLIVLHWVPFQGVPWRARVE